MIRVWHMKLMPPATLQWFFFLAIVHLDHLALAEGPGQGMEARRRHVHLRATLAIFGLLLPREARAIQTALGDDVNEPIIGALLSI